MRIVKKESMDEKDVKSVILDSTLFKGGQQVNGVAYCKSVRETITESGTHYVKLYLMDKGRRVFQANIMNINKRNTTSETINSWIGQPIVIEGDVSYFLGLNIVNITKMEKVAEGVYTEEDFIPQAANMEQEKERFNQHCNSVPKGNYDDMLSSIERLSIRKALSKTIREGSESRIGDGLLICNRLLDQLDSLCDDTDIVDKHFYKYLLILSMGVMYAVGTSENKKNTILNTAKVDALTTAMGIIQRNNLFGEHNMSRGTDEFKHLYSVMYFDEEPKTFISKFYKETTRAIELNLDAIRMEEKVSGGNVYKFGDIEHIRLV